MSEHVVKTVRGAELLVKAFIDKGIERVFSLCGGFINPVYEVLMDYGIQVVTTRHEEIAGHMADGWTRLTREPSVCLTGPEGFTNTVSAMAEAYLERSPVIFIASSCIFRRIERGGFKEIPYHKIAEPITKYSVLVNVGTRIPEFFDKAYDIAVNGNPGPVFISIPVDMLYASYEINDGAKERQFDLTRRKVHLPAPNTDDMKELIDILKCAKRPLIIVGHGVWWARAEGELEKLTSQIGIPVFNVPFTQKIMKLNSKIYFGLADTNQYPPSKRALEEADAIILIGCRLDNYLRFGDPPLFPTNVRLICINRSEEELTDNHVADVRVLGNPKIVLNQLGEVSSELNVDPAWLKTNMAWRKEWVEEMRETAITDQMPIHPLRMCYEVINFLGQRDYLVTDGGDIWAWNEVALNIAGFEGKSLGGVLHYGPFGLLGTGVPFALAAKLRYPESRVVVITGDGAFGCSGLAIETAFQYNLPITVVVDNNGEHGMIAQQQIALFKERKTFGTNLRDIAYHKIVESMGGYGELVEKASEIAPALQRAYTSGRPACLNVKTKTVRSNLTEGLIDRRSKASIE